MGDFWPRFAEGILVVAQPAGSDCARICVMRDMSSRPLTEKELEEVVNELGRLRLRCSKMVEAKLMLKSLCEVLDD